MINPTKLSQPVVKIEDFRQHSSDSRITSTDQWNRKDSLETALFYT